MIGSIQLQTSFIAAIEFLINPIELSTQIGPITANELDRVCD